jgi:RNA polymerase sigma-70 factor (ECF subfamily)
VDREVRLPDRSSLLVARQLLAGGSSPSRQVSREEVARRVNQALAQLADIDREVLMLRTFEGMAYQEIGCLLEIDAAPARKRYGRALLRLRKALIDSGLLEPEP